MTIAQTRQTGTDAFDLTGRRALVTGASRGIGRSIAQELAARGARVHAVARSEDGLQETIVGATDAEGSINALAADLSSPSSISQAVEAAAAEMGGLDILVNNAGWDNEADLTSTTLEDWRAVMDINVQAVFLACQAATPFLIEGGGKIVNVASMFGLVGQRHELAYVTSKHAVVGLTRALALELARKNVQVNALAPGFVETDMLASAVEDEATARFLRRSTPMGRWAQPEEMTGPVVFLTSSASDYMTGQVLTVDGGYTAQ